MAQSDQDPATTGKQKSEDGSAGIGGTFRPLVKELVKAGLVAYEAVSETASGIGKQFNELVEEARSEAVKRPSPGSPPAEDKKKGGGSRSEKGKTP